MPSSRRPSADRRLPPIMCAAAAAAADKTRRSPPASPQAGRGVPMPSLAKGAFSTQQLARVATLFPSPEQL